ncbi:hypothetical protein ACED51_20880 [Photobacterium swingsii]|uniref:hypothetical protein n=1 Tax=Photobacterium swingsii TaxID=680026 RepID=UPI00352DCCF2
MDMYDKALVRKIVTTVGVALGEPTPYQLERIKVDLQNIIQSGRKVDHGELSRVVYKYCRRGPLVCLDSVDNSDLDTVLMLALRATPKK